MFQFLKSLFSRGGRAITVRAAGGERFAGRYQVLSPADPNELWLATAGDSGLTPRFALTPNGPSDSRRLAVSRGSYQRVLDAYSQNDRVIVIVDGLADTDFDTDDDRYDRSRSSSSWDDTPSTPAPPPFAGQGGAFGGGGASGSWDAPAPAPQDAAAAAALGALGVAVVGESAITAAPAAEAAVADAPSDSGSDSASDGGGYDR
jgi:hypothetical protein